MRLLFLTETIPFPLDSGGRIKTYNTLRILAPEHEVHCHAFIREADQRRFEPDLTPLCKTLKLHLAPRSLVREVVSLAKSQLNGVPFTVQRHFSSSVMSQLREECRTHAFDAVYCDHLSMLEYGRRLGLPIIHDAHNVEFEIIKRHASTLGLSPLRAFAELEWRSLERYERRMYPECRLICSVSEIDARSIRRLAGDATPVVVVPIAIDAQATSPVQTLVPSPDIIFVGGLHWPPNADAVVYFAEQIFAGVRKLVPNARFTVVGKNPDAVARRLGAIAGMRFVGHVDDVKTYFDKGRVMVVPIRSGSGMRVKILDGLARGVPIVATSIGCEGIDVEHGRHILVADEPASFAEQVARLLTDTPLAHSIAAAGRQLVLESYDTSVIANRLLQAIHRL